MTKLQRELVSRMAALVLGLALVYGGWRCVAKAVELGEAQQRDFGSQGRRGRGRGSGALPFYFAGGVLLLVGVPTVLFTVLPPGAVERVFRPGAPVSGEPPESEFDRRLSNWLHWRRWW